jgi:5-methylcytosine-specific restriction protein A
VQDSSGQPQSLSSSPTRYQEGQRILVSKYQYERDPRARKACIEEQGTICVVCGFNFGEKYGHIGEGFIHVHHIVPLSERDSEYEIQPERDLKPVCPNCHTMLHRRIPPFTIQELKDLLASVKNG